MGLIRDIINDISSMLNDNGDTVPDNSGMTADTGEAAANAGGAMKDAGGVTADAGDVAADADEVVADASDVTTENVFLRIAVIDDEAYFTDRMAEFIGNCLAQKDYKLKLYHHPKDLLADLWEDTYYDLYFIDVEMPQMSGLEVARHIRRKWPQPVLIFVTAYPGYSIDVFDFNTYRYVLKTCAEEKMPEILENVRKLLAPRLKRQYVIERYNEVYKINHEDIYYIYMDGKYACFETRTGTYRERAPLKQVYGRLDNRCFMMVDKKYIVNMDHIYSLDPVAREVVMYGYVRGASIKKSNIKNTSGENSGNKNSDIKGSGKKDAGKKEDGKKDADKKDTGIRIPVSEPKYHTTVKTLAAFWRGEL